MKRILGAVMAVAAMLGLLMVAPSLAYAEDDCKDGVKTSILFGGGCYKEGEDGEGIYKLLDLILTVMTYGVGVLGTLGIVISGIQYATAGDNEGQIVKAKSRIFNVVIGLLLWAAMYAILQFLIPGGAF